MDTRPPTPRVRPTLALLVSGLVLVPAACQPPSDAVEEDPRPGATRDVHVRVLPSREQGGSPWDIQEDLARLRDSLDAAPDIERPRDPTIGDPTVGEYRYGAPAPVECSPMPNAWIDLPLCRGR